MMENTLKTIVDQAKSVLILLPTRPYFDQVAAGLSLYLAIRGEKEAAVISASPMTVEFNRLVGVNKITQDLGNKNLIIRFSNYEANNIEKVSYDVENREFRLSIIPKQGVSAPTKEQAEITYSGVSADTIILVGGINETHFPALSSNELAGAKIAHVGFRSLVLSTGRNIISLARSASSASEVTAGLLKESGYKIDGDIATNLVMGIEEGSNKFSSSEVTSETFQIFAELMRAGGQRMANTKSQKVSVPPRVIPGRLPKQPAQQVPPPREKTQIETQKENAPKDWLQPKIYKGTNIS
jgi:hypothetical protein